MTSGGHRTWAPTLVAGLVLLVAACGGGDDDATDTTPRVVETTTTTTGSETTPPTVEPTQPPTVPPTEPPTAPPTEPRPTVGEVIDIVPNGGRADDELIAPGSDLRQGALLAADPAGAVDFKLDRKIRRCQARPGSQVRLEPGDGVLLEFVAGTLWCGTTADDESVVLRAGDRVFRASDPVFSLTVGESGEVELRVLQGEVLAGEGENARLVAQDRRATYAPGAASPELGFFGIGEMAADLPTDEGSVARDILGDVTSTLPPVSYPELTLAVSPDRLWVKEGANFLVVVDDRGSQAPAAMTAAFFNQVIGDRWGSAADVVTAAPEEARAALENGEAGILVSPEGEGVPFFQDDDGTVWRFVVNGDDEVAQALAGTLRTSLRVPCGDTRWRQSGEQSCYEDLYSGNFGTSPPPLTPLAPLVGLRP
jgi:hypothetical protein